MILSIGLDFGTSNSSVAVYDGGTPRLLALDPAAPDATVLRSLLYLTRAGERFAGQEALDRYLADNLGRAVKLERRYIGDITMTFAGVGTITTEAHALVDANEPGRLFQSIKSLLPDRVFKKTSLFGVDLTAEDLVQLLAGEILQRAAAQLGEPITRLTVGRPVRFAEGEAEQRLALERLERTFARFGIRQVSFLEEPVAAALSFAGTDGGAREGTAVVFDFGGGTLDVTVVRVEQGGTQVLATGGVPVGGDLLDRRIVEARMLRHFGEGATFGPSHLPVPQHVLRRLLDWQTAFLMNRPETLSLIDEMIRTGSRPRELANLRRLVTHNYGGLLFQAVEQGKRRLSTAGHAVIELRCEEIDVRDVLTREEFEGIIRDQHRRVSDCVRETVARAAVAPADVQSVVTTGGSSRIPLFRRTLQQQFPEAQLVEQDAFTSVAAGLAIAGFARC
jgi:hypothetical chaperone protein